MRSLFFPYKFLYTGMFEYENSNVCNVNKRETKINNKYTVLRMTFVFFLSL
jgi:hypothetical protein